MKDPAMEQILSEFTKSVFGRSRMDAATTQTCVICGKDASHFRDEKSRREYEISRMCQSCQDDVFRGGEDE